MNLEKIVLGCIVSTTSTHDLAIPKLNVAHFSEKYRWVADLLIRMYNKGQPIDLVTVAERVNDESPVSFTELSELLTVSPSDTRNVVRYIELLRDEYLRKWIRGRYGVELGTADDPVEYIENEISKLDALKTESYLEGRELADIINSALEPDIRGVMTNITRLNELDPFRGGHLVAVAGRPSHGKTMFAMDIVRTACKQGKKCLVFSLEMSDKELVRRLLKNDSPDEIASWNLKIIDRGGVDVNYIAANSRIEKPDLVVIDYLGFIKLPEGYAKKTEKIGDVTKSLKNLAKEIDCPVLLLVQSNRQIESRPTKLHQMDDLADSAEIERDSDLVAFVMRYELWGIPEYTDGSSTEASSILQIVKNRHGEIANIRMSRDGFVFGDFNVFESSF